LRLAVDGVDVAVLDIAQQIPGYPQSLGTAAELEDTAEQVRKVGRRAIAIQADVCDTGSVDAAVARYITGEVLDIAAGANARNSG
jgi:hypothetical protein